MAQVPTFVDPALFGRSVQRAPLAVFICGPGEGADGFQLREKIRKYLHRFENCETTYGEDLMKRRSVRQVREDLQTLEAQTAQSVDFTILLLQSPGSIAELGTFSMIPSIRSRLYVLVANRFFGAESYIARGPLSLIARDFKKHVIYFDDADPKGFQASLSFIVSMYKFARVEGSHQYLYEAFYAPKKVGYEPHSYETYFRRLRWRFFDAVVLSTILLVEAPTFSEILRATQMHPDEVSGSLKRLYSTNRIRKVKGRYECQFGYRDSLFTRFDTMKLSRAKATLRAIG